MQKKRSIGLRPKTHIALGVRRRDVIEQHMPRQNRLLAALAPDDFANLLPNLEFVSLPRGAIVYGPGEQEDYLYFLTDGIVARFLKTEDGTSTESAIKGSEGVIGIASLLGGESVPSHTMVLSAGYAYRVRTALLTSNSKHDALMHLLRRYIMALIVQIGQNAVCSRLHSVEKQLCSFILSCMDRLLSNDLTITQEGIAEMLGVRRESITTAAANLKLAGLINYSRGHITVLDRPGLEKRGCECYAVVKREYDRLLSA